MHMRMCFLVPLFSQHDNCIYVKLVLYMYYHRLFHIIDYVTDINLICSISSIIHYSVYLLKNVLFNLIPFNLLFNLHINLFIRFNPIQFIVHLLNYFKVATVVCFSVLKKRYCTFYFLLYCVLQKCPDPEKYPKLESKPQIC